MFIVSLEYQVSLEEVDLFIPEHVEFLNKQYELGHFQLSGRKNPRTGGVILFTLSNREQLDMLLTEDPFYRENIAKYEVIEMLPAKASKEFEFLL
ncbi:GTP cyclohydrolase [Vibrio kanaloae]|uniref:YciI family protein n=1 Tax=Vibrio TaxID=662 RepID=UPI000619155B|nr:MULTISPECIES: YciI family protein [Vibrio]MCG9558786.1 YciI family protein [Vibrio kanaloae]PMM02658.1 GTP cyclohydrolase [Vibrio kanaloae]